MMEMEDKEREDFVYLDQRVLFEKQQNGLGLLTRTWFVEFSTNTRRQIL